MQCPHAILSSVASPAVQYFSTLYYKRQHFLHFIKHEKCNLIFSTSFIWTNSYSKKKSAQYYHKCTWVVVLTTHYSWQILVILIFLTDFEKYWSIKFHENPSGGNRVVPSRRASGRTDPTNLLVTFRNSVKVPKIIPQLEFRIFLQVS
jgi:hypothetical protein